MLHTQSINAISLNNLRDLKKKGDDPWYQYLLSDELHYLIVRILELKPDGLVGLTMQKQML